MYEDYYDITILSGKTLSDIKVDGESILFETIDGDIYKMFHEQDCCESVYIESIVGDLEDLIGEPILRAETGENLFDIIRHSDEESDDEDGTHTWTFYKLATRKGYVDIRWYGSSNGYYSESVDFVKLK